MKRNIVISINTSWNVFNFRAGLIKRLLAEGFDVTILAPRDDFSEKLSSLGCNFVALPMDNKGTSPVKDFRLYLQYRKLLAAIKPDVYLGFTIKPNVYGSLAANHLRIPVINNISGLGTAFIRNNWLTTAVKMLYKVALLRSHTVYFQNRDDRDLFMTNGLVKYEKTALLPGSGINLEHFRPGARAEIKAKDGLVFLLIARLLRDKGVVEYVDAARMVRQKFPQHRFQILGFLDIENQTAITRQQVDGWAGEGVIEYLGESADVRKSIAPADCVVLPSYREGTPRTLLEAAAMEKPLIATDVPGCREVVLEGKNGFLCKVRDCNDLAETILKFSALTENQRADMGIQSRHLMESSFGEDIVIEQYLAAIRDSLQTA